MTAADVERVVIAAMGVMVPTDKGPRPLIQDNDAPIDNNDPDSWWRCYVTDPERFIEFAARYMGHPVNATVATRETATHIGIEYRTAIGKHFAGGKLVGDKIVEGYNPDPKVKTLGIISYRYWRVEAA